MNQYKFYNHCMAPEVIMQYIIIESISANSVTFFPCHDLLLLYNNSLNIQKYNHVVSLTLGAKTSIKVTDTVI